MLSRSLAGTAHSASHQRRICANDRHVCCDHCCDASQADCLEVEKLYACVGIVSRYRHGPDRYGRAEKVMASDLLHACSGMAKVIVCACDGMEKASDLERDSCDLG